jgi:Uma2 family endonuclease
MTPTAATPVTYGHDASMARFSVQRYQRMIEHGILTTTDKVELLEGYIVNRYPSTPLHDGSVHIMMEDLNQILPSGWDLRIKLTLELTDSQPEPDGAVVREAGKTYFFRHPNPADTALVIEVADSSLLRDQRDKTRIYARANIPCYWIVNLVDRRIEVYSQLSGPTAVPAYGSFQIYQPGDAVPLVLDGHTVGTVAADELLP